MSAGDILITIVIWLYQKATSALPTDMGFFPLSVLNAYLDSFSDTLVYVFSTISKIMPIELILILIGVILAGEVILFGIKAGMFVINIIRGSGA